MTEFGGRVSAVNRPGRWAAAIGRRWPTLLALAVSAATWAGGGSDESVIGVGQVLPQLPLLYLIVCKIHRPRASWPVLIAGITATFVLRAADLIDPATVAVAIALIVLLWAAVDGHLRADGLLQLQAIGMIGFGALALTGLALEPEVGRYLIAVGWLLHGAWDFLHLRCGKVVVRSYAEWCGVVDILIAGQLLFLR